MVASHRIIRRRACPHAAETAELLDITAPEDQDRPLPRRQPLDRRDGGEPHPLVGEEARLGIPAGGVVEPSVGDRLEPRCLA
ncbi:hypothetical protein AYJ66_13740 [Dietzia cinnamea]|nr:hypothetical protein AYJ66_13740 [Dietzia cinnamea]